MMAKKSLDAVLIEAFCYLIIAAGRNLAR